MAYAIRQRRDYSMVLHAGDMKDMKDKVRELTDMLEDRKQVRPCPHKQPRNVGMSIVLSPLALQARYR